MAYFPKIGPFYDPRHEQHLYGETDGRLRLRRSEKFSEKTESISETSTGWNHIIQDHEKLFYTENAGNSPVASRLSSHRRQESYQSVGSAGSCQSGSDTPQQPFSRQSSLGSNHSGVSYSSVNLSHQQDRDFYERQRSNHTFDQFQRDNNLRQSDSSYDSFSQNLQTDNGALRTRKKLHMKIPLTSETSCNSSGFSVTQSGKRKSVVMVPDLKNLTNDTEASGVMLCEVLFGIKLCQYKQRPPRPNGTCVDHVLRDRKIIVQGVVPNSQADICAQINRGDMLVALNDIDLTWINLDEVLRQATQQQKVKLTFQVPVVVGPKQSTPPVTPTRNTPPLPRHSTPPLPPHIPPRIPLVPLVPPRPPGPQHWIEQQEQSNLVTMTTGESESSLRVLLSRWLFAVMYLTFAGQSESSKDSVTYQYPGDENKLTSVGGLFLTLSGLLPDVTSNQPKLTSLTYRGKNTHIVYWREEQDVLVMCLPETRVPISYMHHIFSDLLRLIRVLHGSVSRVFKDKHYHQQLDELIQLTLYRVLHSGVQTQVIPHCNPLEPVLVDTLTGVRWLKLADDDKMSCDEILNEYEAQDFMEIEEIDPNARRNYGILGSCLFYRDYLLTSHMCQEHLKDVHLFLKYHCILHLVSKQPVDDLVIWREVYPTHLCHTVRVDNPGYCEPKGRWFLLVVSMRHFLLCTVFECGSYSRPAVGTPSVDDFMVEQSRLTLAQLDLDDTDIELQCNERLFSEQTGPRLSCLGTRRCPSQGTDTVSPLKSTPSPRYASEDGDRSSLQSPNGQGIMKRQGSKLSYGSNDSSGSSSSINKLKSASKKGSMYDVDTINRSFSRDGSKSPDIKLTKGLHNQLFHYVNFDKFEGIYLSPFPIDLSSMQGSAHQHLLYNFYACCLRLHSSFETQFRKKMSRDNSVPVCCVEEGLMFTCQLPSSPDPKKQAPVARYWVIGRRFADGHEMFVCLEDGAPQTLLELAFTYNFGLT